MSTTGSVASSRQTFVIREEVLSLASTTASKPRRRTKGPRSTRSTRSGRSKASRRAENTYVASLMDESGPRLQPFAGIADQAGRVKVCVRCRPPFREEVNTSADVREQLVVAIPPHAPNPQLVQLYLEEKSKRREFYFDRAFPPTTTQDSVYNEVAGPIVANVMDGFNGTVLAYGQTGTGKTYTMGILNRVVDEHAGLIPRAIGHVFGHVAQHPEREWVVSMSFIQIYLETIQDLFAPDSYESDSGAPENLAVREDPQHGFYVEGLHEYVVRNFEEAVELLNWGLENRVMGCTKMNATSSRSHTVLTVSVKQHGKDDTAGVITTRRGKLIFVDLAGSERVRRTTSTGARLSEAKSINTSLSALGNVIAALSDPQAQHVPFRDSKLTRLLQDSLGGKANTYLIATIGPAAINASETLSTLLFASRCMRVASNPVVNEEVDYAELAASLQMQVAGMEREMMERERQLTDQYEDTIRHLHGQLSAAQQAHDTMQEQLKEAQDNAMEAGPASVLQGSQLLALTSGDGAGDDASEASVPDGIASARALNHCYAMLCDVYRKSVVPICDNMARYARSQSEWRNAQSRDDETEKRRATSEAALAAHDDPSLATLEDSQVPRRLSHAEARTRVGMRHESNSRPLPRGHARPDGSNSTRGTGDGDSDAGSGAGAGAAGAGAGSSGALVPRDADDDVSVPLPAWPLPPVATPSVDHPPLSGFADTQAFMSYVTQLHTTVLSNLSHVGELLELKDVHFNRIKSDLVAQMVARRRQDRKIASSQVVLKFMFDTNARLRGELRHERESTRRPSQPEPRRTDAHSVASFSSSTYGVSASPDRGLNGHGAGAGAGAGANGAESPSGVRPSITVQRIVDRHRVSQTRAPEPAATHRSSLPLPKLAARRVMGSPSAAVPPAVTPNRNRRPSGERLAYPSAPGNDGDPSGAILFAPSPTAERTRGSGAADAAVPEPVAAPAPAPPAPAAAAAADAGRSSSTRDEPTTPFATPAPNPIGRAAYEAPTPVARAVAPVATVSTQPPQDTEGPGAGANDGEDDGDVLECIVAATIAAGQLMYKVHWQGAADSEDEWFSRDELAEYYPDVVAEFERTAVDPSLTQVGKQSSDDAVRDDDDVEPARAPAASVRDAAPTSDGAGSAQPTVSSARDPPPRIASTASIEPRPRAPSPSPLPPRSDASGSASQPTPSGRAALLRPSDVPPGPPVTPLRQGHSIANGGGHPATTPASEVFYGEEGSMSVDQEEGSFSHAGDGSLNDTTVMDDADARRSPHAAPGHVGGGGGVADVLGDSEDSDDGYSQLDDESVVSGVPGAFPF